MQLLSSHRRRAVTATVAALGALGLAGFTGVSSPTTVSASPQSSDTNPVGLVCTHGTDGANFSLETDYDYINLPDGNTAYMYGYKLQGGHFQHPSPVLCVTQGETVTISLTNTLPRAVSIMFPGQTNVTANGQPASPEFDGPAGAPTSKVTSLTNTAAANGGTVTYSFVAGHPGTFLYESGTDSDVQVRMGLFGALVVRPTGANADTAYGNDETKFTTVANTNIGTNTGANNTEEFLALLSEIDPYLNQAIENKDLHNLSSNYSLDKYHPRYWLINGRGFPDSIADNGAAWLPNQPYGSLAEVREWDATGHKYSALTRYINVGTETYPFHPHGNNGRIVGRDGEPLKGPGGQDQSYEKFSIDIGPGQTYDVMSKWYDAENYSTEVPVPVEIPQVANQVFGMFYSGSPYLGVTGPQPPGNQSLNQCGEFYIIAHNHALYQITSWGVNMTGPITYMRIDPSSTCA